jgi:hypothetical protein
MFTVVTASAERIPGDSVNCFFDEQDPPRRVRRIANWFDMIASAITRLGNDTLERKYKHQAKFRYGGRHFKVRINRTIGRRGGIEIVEYFRSQGSPEGDVVVQIANLHQAEQLSANLEGRLDQFIHGFTLFE